MFSSRLITNIRLIINKKRFSTVTDSERPETTAETGNQISTVAQQNLLTCSPDTSLQAVTQLMQENTCSSILVIENNQPVGIWTEADALNIDYSSSDQWQKPVADYMSTSLKTISGHHPLEEAAVQMKQQGLRHLVVTDQRNEVSGILTQSDVINHQEAEFFVSMTEVRTVLPSQQAPLLEQHHVLDDAVKLMKERKSDALVVTRKGSPVGLITQRDLIRFISKGKTSTQLHQVMSSPLLSIPQTMSLLATRSLMQKRHIRHLGVNGDNGQLLGLISFQDILDSIEQTYVRRLRTALTSKSIDLQNAKQELHMAHTLIEASMDGIMVTNEDGYIEMINPAFSILTGYSEAEALGKPASLISSGKHDAEFYNSMWDSIRQNGFWKGEIWNRRKSGETYLEWLTITRIVEPNSDRVLYAGIFSDITERKKSEQIIENLAYYDPLTKLPNRQLLYDRLDIAIASAHRDKHKVALLFIDLDHFKRINDTLGHTTGDQVLIMVAERIRGVIREGDTLSRLGGDELILLLTEVSEEEIVSRMAKRIIDILQDCLRIQSYELHISASIGCAMYPDDGSNREELLQKSDIAMYRAKQGGRNNFRFYSAKMDEQTHQALKLESRLRKALQNKEFYLEYQPKISLTGNQILGVEALIRWHDQELGQVRPDQFIPLAEDLGLINEIGNWVLQEAAAQSQRWQAMALPPLQVSVNVSALQFKQGRVIEQVESALEATALQPDCLDLEITETCLISDLESVTGSLKYLRGLGLSISLDDFGTGFSSLNMLTQLEIDHLKIDRSFMQGIPGAKDKEVLVSTIILMAHNLGFKVIAEGVETEQQMQFLIDKSCDQMQGYYFSKPVSADVIAEMYRKQLTAEPA